MSSRFLNSSPRSYIRQKDSINILPSIIRTGYQNEQGVLETPFSDSETILFKTGAILMAPYMVSSSIASSSGFLTGSLFVTGTLQSKTAYLDTKIENDLIFPFKEGFITSNPAGYDSSQDEGFPESQLPGFSSPESDKSAIVIDITSDITSQITKLSRIDSLRDPAGPFAGNSKSGFMYYNFTSRRWTDQGTRDPSTLGLLNYSPVFRLSNDRAMTSGENLIISGTGEIMCQFGSSPYSITSENSNYVPTDIDALRARGYNKIGEPTSFFGAPGAPRFYADSDRALKMSRFIRSPFVVDRISLKIPVTAIRTQTPQTGAASYDFGFGRDIDNYTFFVYVQNRTGAPVGGRPDISSSIRYLVAKESFCFYNSATLDLVSNGTLPIHSYGQALDFGMGENDATTAGRAVTSEISTDINLTFRPQTFNCGFGSISKFPGSDHDSATSYTGSVFVQNYWKGGQVTHGYEPLSDGPNFDGEVSLVNDTKNLNIRSGTQSQNSFKFSVNPSARSLASSFWIGSNERIVSGSGFCSPGNEILTVSTIGSSQETPIVLFPEDEIIFGIESGVNSNMHSPGRGYDGLDNDVLLVTGSRIQIETGDARVVFYGSSILQNKEKLPSLNQYLGSDAVHEDIFEDGPFDQFDTLNRLLFYNVYSAQIFSGNFFKGNRQQIGTLAAEPFPLSGSFQRNIRHISDGIIYYDTLIPTISEISGGLANTSQETSGNLIDQSTLKIVADSTNGYASENKRNSDSLLRRSWTYETHTGTKRIKNIKINLYSPAGALVNSYSGDQARMFLYYNSSIRALSGFGNQKNYEGAGSLRYGLLSTRLVGPSWVFRRDRYGQFRDMLEQSRDGKTVTPAKNRDTISAAVVVATFVSASSDIIADPQDTQCSNLSFECTSSYPFIDDGLVHNRGPVNSTIVKFGANNLLFGITGSFGFNN